MRIGLEQDRENDERRTALARLRAEMDGAPGSAADAGREGGGWTLGDAALDGAVVGLSPAALHEAAPASAREAGAVAGFAVALALRRLAGLTDAGQGRPVFWCVRRTMLHETGALSGRGLADLGADPAAFLLAAARHERDVLWALEEAVRSSAVALAVGEVEGADLVATRRLSLAAREHGVPVLLLQSARALGPSTARTRWKVAAAPGRPARYAPRAPGRARWRVALEKGWAGRPREWIVEWDHEAHHIRLAAPLADHAADGEEQPGGAVVPHVRAG